MKKIIAVVLLAQSTFCLGMQSRWQNSLACLFKKVDQSVQKHPYVYIAGAVGLALGTPKLISLLPTLKFSQRENSLKKSQEKEEDYLSSTPSCNTISRSENTVGHIASTRPVITDFSKVTIKLYNRREIDFPISENDTLDYLKMKIQDRLDIPPDQQRLLPIIENAVFRSHGGLEDGKVVKVLMQKYNTCHFMLEPRLRD